MEEKAFNAGKAWLTVIVAILAQVVFAIGLMKAPANFPLIMAGLQIDAVAAGNMMNANGIVALILALPAGLIMQKLGARNVLIAALAITICGNIVGILAGNNFTILIASRAIEGFGYGMQVVTAPQFIAEWFPAQKRGLPNGLSSIWFSIGQLIILNVAAHLPGAAEGSWTGSWWFTIIVMVIMLIAVIIFVHSPKAEENQLEINAPKEGAEKVSVATGLKSATTWLILLVFFLFGYVNSAFASYYNTFLVNFFGLDLGAANSITSIATIAMLVAGILGGFVLNKVKVTARPMYLLILTVLVGIMGLIMFNVPSLGMVTPFLIIFGFVLQLFPGAAYSVAPEAAATPETVPTTMGVLGIGQNFAGVFGTLITSLFLVPTAVMAADGSPVLAWASVTIPNAIFMVIGVIAAIAMLPLMKKQYKKFGIVKD